MLTMINLVYSLATVFPSLQLFNTTLEKLFEDLKLFNIVIFYFGVFKRIVCYFAMYVDDYVVRVELVWV